MCLSLWLNIILILSTAKTSSELSLCSRLKRYVLMVSTLAFVYKLFFAVKKVNFPELRKFSLIKELSRSHGNFPWSRNFFTVKKNFHSQRKLSIKIFFTNKKVFCKNFFSLIKNVFHSQESFPEKETFWKQRSKRFSKSQNRRSIQY